MKINLKAFAFACSIFWGAALFLVTWWVIILDGASGDPTWLSRVYRGYMQALILIMKNPRLL